MGWVFLRGERHPLLPGGPDLRNGGLRLPRLLEAPLSGGESHFGRIWFAFSFPAVWDAASSASSFFTKDA